MALPNITPNVEAQTAPPPRSPLLPRLLVWATWLLFAFLLYVSVVQTNFGFRSWAEAQQSGVRFVLFFRNLWPPDWRALADVWPPLIETLRMAWLGTLFGVILGVPWLFWSSRTTTPNGVVLWVSRTIMTLLRSIPDLLVAAVLVGVLALGPLPGVVALTLFTVAILAKLGSEYVEAVDPGPLEALRATGAGGLHVIVYGVVPQIAASMVSYVLYIFEVNVRASTVLGYVGAGGVGQLLNTWLALFRYRDITVLLLIIFVVVLMIDAVSAFVRSRLT